MNNDRLMRLVDGENVYPFVRNEAKLNKCNDKEMCSEKQLYKGLDNHAATPEAMNLNSIFYETNPKRSQS